MLFFCGARGLVMLSRWIKGGRDIVFFGTESRDRELLVYDTTLHIHDMNSWAFPRLFFFFFFILFPSASFFFFRKKTRPSSPCFFWSLHQNCHGAL